MNFQSFFIIEIAQVIEIFFIEDKDPTKSILWHLMTWSNKEPGSASMVLALKL